MKYTFQHFVDIATSASSMQVIQIQAGGQYMLQRTKHLFPAFKYMKLGRVSIKLIPASTLPVDPLGLSYDDSDPQSIDPRDQMNPGLVRITNGEDIFTDISSLTDDQSQAIYNNMMLDPRWSKFMLQSGFKRSAVPLYWQIGQLHQDYFPGATVNKPIVTTNGVVESTITDYMFSNRPSSDGYATVDPHRYVPDNSDPRGLFQVGHRGRMGWIPTDALAQYGYNDGVNEKALVNAMPSINVITCVLPKAHKTLYYYRLFITETIYLSGLKNTGINGELPNQSEIYPEYRGLDNFVISQNPVLAKPNVPEYFAAQYPFAKNDGEGKQ